MQMLYHINFGTPLLEAGAQIVAPLRTLVPRNARAAEGVRQWHTYGSPQAGFAEQVYFADLVEANHRTQVLLKNGAGSLGASLAYDKRQLPCFTLWKNTGALGDGYVTGLEPATNFPNPRSFEATQGRVVKLLPGTSAQFDMAIALHTDAASVAQAQREIEALQGNVVPEICPAPRLGWTEISG
jgi:hypothetical protein